MAFKLPAPANGRYYTPVEARRNERDQALEQARSLANSTTPSDKRLLELFKKLGYVPEKGVTLGSNVPQDILALLGDTRGRVMSDLAEFGDSLINDTTKTYTDKRNELLTDLADRGLGGSTKRIAVEAMAQREKDAALNRIKDMLLERRLAADERFTDKAIDQLNRQPAQQPVQRPTYVPQYAPPVMPSLAGPTREPGSRSKPGVRKNALAPAATKQTVADKIAAINARRAADGAAATELARRAAMIGLQRATGMSGIGGEAETRNALAWLQQNGWATYNPSAGTPMVPAARVPIETYYAPPQYSGYPSYQTAGGYGRGAAYNARIAGYKQARNAGMHQGWSPSGGQYDMMRDALAQMKQNQPNSQSYQPNYLGNLLTGVRGYFGI